MIGQADQPRLAGMGALIGHMIIGSITILIYYCQKPLSALLG